MQNLHSEPTSNKDKEDYLKKCTVAIRESQKGVIGTIGTGVIVTEDGLILTCYHVIGDIRKETPYYKTVDIYFTEADVTKQAEIAIEYCNPCLDIAFLRLQGKEGEDKKLPENSIVAYLSETIYSEHKFKSFGFRKPKQFAGLFSDIKILGRTREISVTTSFSQHVLQISSAEIEPGMSGSAVFDMETNRVVGIIFQHNDTRGTVDTNLNFAIPVSSIVKVYPDIKERNIGLLTKPRKIDEDLKNYLQYVHLLRFSPHGDIDDKNLNDYYIPCKAIRQDKDTWEYKDSDIEYSENDDWTVEKFLKGDQWFAVVGASFGTGKSSFATYITSGYASKYLEGCADPNDYIPVLVPLEYKLEKIDDKGNTFDYVLKSIIAPDDESKKKRILVIFDGLDEYGKDIQNLKYYINKLRDKREGFPNMKFIITTRLESGYPEKLMIDEYIRLLPFDKVKVEQFFQKYHLNIKFEDLKGYGLDEEEITKPLFCWMLSLIFLRFKKTKDAVFKGSGDNNLNRAMIYQEFIHSIIIGKYKEHAKEYGFIKYSKTEKQLLRKIAALKQIHSVNLTKRVVNEKLNKFGLNLGTILDPILATYFSLQNMENPDNDDQLIEFMHNSFKEYLLAEYYIESIIEGKPYRLDVGVPSRETILFLDGLLELLLKNDGYYKQRADDLLKSFDAQNCEENEKSSYLGNRNCLIENAKRTFEDVQTIVFRGISEHKEIWNTARIRDHYTNFWIDRWISFYILNKLEPEKLDKEELVKIIRYSSHLIPSHFKTLKGVNIEGRRKKEFNLKRVDFSWAQLQEANLINADLAGAFFLKVDLSNSKLKYADLSRANLHLANLTDTDLSNADLQGARLEGSTLVRTVLSNSTLTRANLKESKVSHAHLDGADLSGADLQCAKIQDTDLSGADLSRTILYGSTIERIKVNDETKAYCIILLPYEDNDDTSKQKEALNKIDENLRKIILRDNPNFWQQSTNKLEAKEQIT